MSTGEKLEQWLWGTVWGGAIVRFWYFMGWTKIDPYDTAHPYISILTSLVLSLFIMYGVILFNRWAFPRDYIDKN
jgi:hypothetical protein